MSDKIARLTASLDRFKGCSDASADARAWTAQLEAQCRAFEIADPKSAIAVVVSSPVYEALQALGVLDRDWDAIKTAIVSLYAPVMPKDVALSLLQSCRQGDLSVAAYAESFLFALRKVTRRVEGSLSVQPSPGPVLPVRFLGVR
jgi:hypothetical protein